MLEFIEVNKIYNNDVCALKDLSFKVEDGEFVFLIGASGAGKTSIIKMLLREIKPTSGEIIVDDVNIVKLRNRKIPQLRKTMGVVFQDFRLLEGKTVFDNIKYPLQILGVSKRVITKRVTEILELVGLSDRANSFPNQLSGGEQQRVCIARALVNKPKYLIADEPTTALDVTIQAQILNLMKQIQKERGSSIIFITHDLGVVAGMADRVAVMYAGKIIEYGTVDEVFYNPQHPYTWGLLNSMPTTDTEAGSLQSIPGTPPDLLNPPKGDAFAPRNEFALDIDYEEEPPMFKVSDTHFAATWLLDERAPKVTPPLPIQKRWAKWKELEGRKA